ncbi:MAG: hypothetical protein JXM72_11165 [Deltaproteobacteria bacterium]|nr:hypothetical protein [Deltaproteobacteria bacterium]
MAVILDFKIHFFIAFLILLLLLLMIPVRAETAEAGIQTLIEQESQVLHDNARFSRSYATFISKKVHFSDFMRKNQPGSAFDALLKISGFHVRTYIPDTLSAQEGQPQKEDAFSIENISTRIRPLVEISYALSNRIALEVRGHLNRYIGRTGRSSGEADERYEYTFFVGPSLYAGSPGDKTRLYTQFGLGYNVIDTGTDIFSKDCPTSLGTGFSLGLKRNKSDIRIGYNYFREFSDTSSQMGMDERLNPSSLFLFVTYNFDT